MFEIAAWFVGIVGAFTFLVITAAVVLDGRY